MATKKHKRKTKLVARSEEDFVEVEPKVDSVLNNVQVKIKVEVEEMTEEITNNHNSVELVNGNMDPKMQKMIDEEAMELSKILADVDGKEFKSADCEVQMQAYVGHLPPIIDLYEKMIRQAIIKYELNRTAKDKYKTPMQYKCNLCQLYFTQIVYYKKHLNCFHKNPKDIIFVMEIINKQRTLVSYLFGRSASPASLIYCFDCSEQFQTTELLNKHKSIAELPCKKCSVTFGNCRLLKEHKDTCNSNDLEVVDATVVATDNVTSILFKCSVCNAYFNTEKCLNDHLVTVHVVRTDVISLVRLNRCRECNQVIPAGRMVHNCPKRKNCYPCKYCKERFQTPLLRKVHMAAMPGENVKCDKCNTVVVKECMIPEHKCPKSVEVVMQQCKICFQLYPEHCDLIKTHLKSEHNVPDFRIEHMIKKVIVGYYDDDITPVSVRTGLPKIMVVTGQLDSTTKSASAQLDDNQRYEVMDEKPKEPNELNNELQITPIVDDDDDDVLSDNGPQNSDAGLNVTDKDNINDCNKNQIEETENNTDVEEVELVDDKEEVISVNTDLNESETDDDSDLNEMASSEIKDQNNTNSLKSFNENKPGQSSSPKRQLDDDEFFKVFKPSTEFTVEIKEEPIDESEIFGQFLATHEVKEEPMSEYEDDLIILHPNDDVNNSYELQDSDNLEQYIIAETEIKQETNETPEEKELDAEGRGYEESFKRLYSCKRCKFSGIYSSFCSHKRLCRKSKSKIVKKRKILTPAEDYTCKKCFNTFKSFGEYICHYIYVNCANLQCPYCSERFADSKSYVAHTYDHVKQLFIRTHVITKNGTSESNKYICRKCQKPEQQKNFVNHWLTHSKVSEAVCSKSEKGNRISPDPVVEVKMKERVHSHFIANDDLKTAIDTLMQVKKFMRDKTTKCCKICNKRFDRFNDLKRHLIEHLLANAYSRKVDIGFLRCQICSDDLVNADEYKRHMRDHGALPLYQCKMCCKSFSDSSNFAKHKKVHNLSTIVCDMCHKKFNSKVMLLRHLEDHKKSKLVHCDKCDRVFYFQSMYLKHYKSKHMKRQQKFACCICKLRFFSLKEKWNHLWEVHQERKCKVDCPFCEARFRKMQDLKKHLIDYHYQETNSQVIKNLNKSFRERTKQ